MIESRDGGGSGFAGAQFVDAPREPRDCRKGKRATAEAEGSRWQNGEPRTDALEASDACRRVS